MRNLNLDQLQTLIAIADLGTFAAAAEALHLAPPTVSMHIKELESRLQADLVVRGRRQAELTPAGEVLVQEGRQLLPRCGNPPGGRGLGRVHAAPQGGHAGHCHRRQPPAPDGRGEANTLAQ